MGESTARRHILELRAAVWNGLNEFVLSIQSCGFSGKRCSDGLGQEVYLFFSLLLSSMRLET